MNGGDPATLRDDEIGPDESWRRTRSPRYPADQPAIARFRGLVNWLISEFRVSSLDRARDAVDFVTATKDSPAGVVPSRPAFEPNSGSVFPSLSIKANSNRGGRHCYAIKSNSLRFGSDCQDTKSMIPSGGTMVIGDRLKTLRAQKNLSQGDIEERTGLLRCYVSRVENGHTVPSVDTLEKIARALEVPMYRLFTDEEHVQKLNLPTEVIRRRAVNSKQERELRAFAKHLSRMDDKDRGLLIRVASKMANRA
jgi:transcriptional regulator with XRE-family HTH domain